MNFYDEIVRNAGLEPVEIKEMASQHFDDEILDFILKSEYALAAQKYIDNQQDAGYKVPKKATATVNKLKKQEFSKSFTADQEKARKIRSDEWDKFSQAYEQITGAGEKREYKTQKGSIDKATGEIKTSGRDPKEAAQKLRDKVAQLGNEFKDLADNATSKVEKEELLSHFEGLKIIFDALGNTMRGLPTFPPEREEEIRKLEQRYERIGKVYIRKAGKSEDEMDAVTPQERAMAVSRVKARLTGVRDFDDVEDLWKEYFQIKKEREKERVGKSDVFSLRTESLNVKGKILAESMSYKGSNFWANYFLSNITRSFIRDKEVFGENTKDVYISTFGLSTEPLFEYMEENSSILTEALNIYKGEFLFEEYAYDVINETLDVLQLSGGDSGGGGSFKKTSLLRGILGGLWRRFKDLGSNVFSRLGTFVQTGAEWAKQLVSRGLGWLNTLPIPAAVIPSVLIGGSIVGGIALINRLRKKAGKKRLSKQEQEQFRTIAAKKKPELEAKARKAIDDEDYIVSDED